MEFDEYVAARGPALERYAFVLTGDAQRSQDLVQTALVKAYRRWRWVVRAGHPDAYVRRIVTTSYLDWRRLRSSGEHPVETLPDVAVNRRRPLRPRRRSRRGTPRPRHPDAAATGRAGAAALRGLRRRRDRRGARMQRGHRACARQPRRPAVAGRAAAEPPDGGPTMPDLAQLLADAFDDLAAHAPHAPRLAERVRTRARRGRLVGGAALAGLVAAAVAVVAVVAVRPDAEGASSALPGTSVCRSTVVTGVLPEWARGGFSDPKPVMPYVTSASGRIVAIIWEPLTGPPRDDSGDKVLWVWQRPTGGVHAVARLDGTGPAVSFVDPGVTGPSSVRLPSPGCWRVTVTWPGGSDTIDLAAARP